MKELKAVSRWIQIKTLYVTEKHSLFDYAEKDAECMGKYPVMAFRWKNHWYALDSFLSRYGICGFDRECKEYPTFITGYDGNNYYNPLLMELDEYGEKCRLYEEG